MKNNRLKEDNFISASAGSASQAFRRAMANATSKPNVCESEDNGTRFAMIRADSRFYSLSKS